MVGRTKSDRHTNATFEALQLRIGGLENALKGVNAMIGMMMDAPGGNLAMPEPTIPFKIAEESTAEGPLVTVGVRLPAGDYDVVRIFLIRKSDNTLKMGESQEDAIERAVQKVLRFVVQVTDIDRMLGTLVRQIGPIPFKDDDEDSDKNKIQLLRLVAANKDSKLSASNPENDPTGVGTFPFEVLTVDVNAGKFFTIGNPVSDAPSGPSQANIICNRVNLETPNPDATVTFRIDASKDDPTKSFLDLGVSEAYAIIKKVGDPALGDGSIGEDDAPIKVGGAISDRTAKFFTASRDFPLAGEYEWVRTLTVSSSGREKTTASGVRFFAGGTNALTRLVQAYTGQVGASTDGRLKITAEQQDNGFTDINVFFTQPALGVACTPDLQAVLFRRIKIERQRKDGTFKEVSEPLVALKDETLFTSGEKTITRSIPNQPNRLNIVYRATLVGLKGESIEKIVAMTTGNSTFTDAPSAPNINRVQTDKDSETEKANDSYADFTVFAVAAENKTFRETGCDNIGIVLQKKNDQSDDDPDPDGGTLVRLPTKIFPVLVEDLDRTSAVFRVRDLNTGDNLIWKRNIAFRGGLNAKSAVGNVAFRAGRMILDPSGVGISGVATKIKKRRAEIAITIVQPAMAVLLKNVEIHQDLGDGAGFIEVRQIPLKGRAEVQIDGATATIRRRVEIDPGNANIRYFLRLRAIGNRTKDSAIFNQGAAGAPEAPTDLPAIPTGADIVFNGVNLDKTMGMAKVTVRVFADWTRTKTFGQVMADSAKFILVDQGDGSTIERYPSPASPVNPNDTFVLIEFPSLVAGKAYILRKAITFRNGVPAKSGNSEVAFVAGGNIGTIGTPGLPELSNVSVAVTQIFDDAAKGDSRSAEYTTRFTQALSQVGTGTVTVVSGNAFVQGNGTAFFTQLRLGYTISVFGQTRTVVGIFANSGVNALLVDTPFAVTTTVGFTFMPPVILLKRLKPYIVRNNNPGQPKPRKGDRILDEDFDDNNQPIVFAGAKQLTDDINVPKKSNFFVRVRLIAVGGNFRDVDSNAMLSDDDKGFSDAGPPTGLNQNGRMRWTNRHLRVNFTSSFISVGGTIGTNNNLNTQVTNKILFYFVANGQFYLWNPIDRQTLLTAFPIVPLTDSSQAAFFIDIGKQSVVSFPNGIPQSQNDGFREIDADDSVVYNLIQAGGGSLICNFYVFNQFNDVLTGASVGQAAAVNIAPAWGVDQNGF